jgi:hypothetical protein
MRNREQQSVSKPVPAGIGPEALPASGKASEADYKPREAIAAEQPSLEGFEPVTKVTETTVSAFTATKRLNSRSIRKECHSVTSVTPVTAEEAPSGEQAEASVVPTHAQAGLPTLSKRLGSRLLTPTLDLPDSLDRGHLQEWLKPRAGESYEEWGQRYDRAEEWSREQQAGTSQPIVTRARESERESAPQQPQRKAS